MLLLKTENLIKKLIFTIKVKSFFIFFHGFRHQKHENSGFKLETVDVILYAIHCNVLYITADKY